MLSENIQIARGLPRISINYLRCCSETEKNLNLKTTKNYDNNDFGGFILGKLSEPYVLVDRNFKRLDTSLLIDTSQCGTFLSFKVHMNYKGRLMLSNEILAY